MIFIIDNYFANDHREECIVVKSKKYTIEEMTEIVGALANLYHKHTNQRFCAPRALKNILCTNLDCTDKKHKYRGEIDFVESRISSPMLHATFLMRDEILVWLDISEAMDYTFARMFSILEEYFNDEEIENIKESWKEVK